MMKKMFFTALASAALFMGTSAFAQGISPESIPGLLKKPMASAEVQSFVLPLSLDGLTGISYENGVQVFHDGTTLYEIYFFNNTNLNGQPVKAYREPLPFKLTFKETMETLKKKLGPTPSAKGEHWVWKLGNLAVEIAFADDKKTELAFVALAAE